MNRSGQGLVSTGQASGQLNMADNMSHNPAQSKDKVRPGAPGATTGSDDAVLERKKTPSFQITSVTVATRVSNDGGDDSADDLDDSRTDDISEAVDVDVQGSTSMSVSRLTDLETPSFSEESFSKDDVFFNTSAAALGSAPVIPTSSQYGLAIVANLEGDNPNPSSPVNCINSVSANDVHVNVSVAEANIKQSETDSSHSHPGRNERFKVVKIESTEPFKRGRWMCMDYLDHTTQQQPQSQTPQQPHIQQQPQLPPQAQAPQQLQQQQHAQQQQQQQQLPLQPMQQPQMQPQVTLVQHSIPKPDCNEVITPNMGMSPYPQDTGVMMNDSIVKNVGPDDHQGSVLDPSVIAQMANSMIAPVSSPDQHQQAMLASQRHQVAQQSMAMGQMPTSSYQPMAGQSLPHVAIPSSQPQQVVMQGQQIPQTMPQQMAQSFQPQASSAAGLPQQILQPQHPQSMTQVPYQPQPVSQHQSLPQQQLQHVIQVHQQQYQQQTIPQMQQLQQQIHQQQLQQQQLLQQQQSQQQLQQQQLQQMQQQHQQHQMQQQQQMQHQQLQQQQIAAAMQQQHQQQQQQQQQQHQVLPQVAQQPPHSAGQHPVISQVVQQQAPHMSGPNQQAPHMSAPNQQSPHMSAPNQQSQYYSPQQGSIIQPKVVTMQQAQNQAGGYPTQTSMTVTQTQNVNSTTHLSAMSQGASMPQQSMTQSMAQSLQAQSLQAQSLQAQLPPQQHQHQQHPHQQSMQMAGQALSQMQTLGQGQSLPQNLTSSSVPSPGPQQQQISHQQLAGQSMPQMQQIAPAQNLNQGVPPQSVPQSSPHPQITNQLPPLQTMAQVQNLPQSISQSSVPQPAPQQGQMGIAPQPMMPMQMQQSQNNMLAPQQQQQQQQPQPQQQQPQHYPMVSNSSPQAFSNPTVSSSGPIMSPHSGGVASVAPSGVSNVVDPVTGTVLGTLNNPVELQSGLGVVSSSQNGSAGGPANALLESLVEATHAVDDVAPGNTDDTESASGTNAVAIDNKIEQAMDLVKSHLMFAVREEVEVLKEKIAELMDRISQLELENSILKAHATQETLAQLNSSSGSSIQPQGQQGSVSQGQSQQTPPQSTQPPQHQNGS